MKGITDNKEFRAEDITALMAMLRAKWDTEDICDVEIAIGYDPHDNTFYWYLQR